MREIKFRGWNPESEKMISWNYMLATGWTLRDLNTHGDIELMQYTGLKDNSKTPKEIYEGDIVKTSRYLGTPEKFEDVIGKVVYLSPEFKVEYMDSFYCDLHGGSEVIGNIYSNKELLK